jgi:hypothetical protein
VNGVDQRGHVRPGTGYANCSIGAYEYDSSCPPVVTATPTFPATRTASVTATPSPTRTPAACIGDCDGKGTVTVDEVLTLVNIALGNAQPLPCAQGIPSGVEVDVALILQAVSNAMNGRG